MRQHSFLPRMALSLLVLFGLMQFSTLAFGASISHVSANLRVGEAVTWQHWVTKLASVGAPNSAGQNPATFDVSYNDKQGGRLKGSTQLYPQQSSIFGQEDNQLMDVYLVNTYNVNNRPLSADVIISVADATVEADAGQAVTIYQGVSAKLGKWSVMLSSLGTPSNDITPVELAIFYNGLPTNQTSLTEYYPNDAATFTVKGHVLHLSVTQIEDGIYYYQQWAKIKLSQS